VRVPLAVLDMVRRLKERKASGCKGKCRLVLNRPNIDWLNADSLFKLGINRRLSAER
jgi:hypothetical protein